MTAPPPGPPPPQRFGPLPRTLLVGGPPVIRKVARVKKPVLTPEEAARQLRVRNWNTIADQFGYAMGITKDSDKLGPGQEMYEIVDWMNELGPLEGPFTLDEAEQWLLAVDPQRSILWALELKLEEDRSTQELVTRLVQRSAVELSKAIDAEASLGSSSRLDRLRKIHTELKGL